MVLRGARQVGKTELVRLFAKSQKLKLVEINLEQHLYLNDLFKSLSIHNIVKELESLTHSSLAEDNTLLFMDEIQAAPYALQALRYFYEDMPSLPVISAGSLLEFTLKDHHFSMPVGKIEYFHLGPFSFKEFLTEIEPGLIEYIEQYQLGNEFTETAHRKLSERQREFLFVGGMPEAILAYSESGSLEEAARVHSTIVNTYYDDFSKYAKAKELLLLQKIFTQVPRYIGNKVKYTNFSRDERSGNVKNAVDLLIKAGICYPVIHSNCSGIPLQADINELNYKLLFLDTGLAGYINGLNWYSLSSYDNVSLVNEGRLAEQFIGQHLYYRSQGFRKPVLHYWLREGRRSNAEVDFVISEGNWIIPVEVKAGKQGTLKSLFRFILEKKNPGVTV